MAEKKTKDGVETASETLPAIPGQDSVEERVAEHTVCGPTPEIKVDLDRGRSNRWADRRRPRLSDALGLSDIENLSTVLISISPHHVFKILKNADNGFPRTCHEISTSVR